MQSWIAPFFGPRPPPPANLTRRPSLAIPEGIMWTNAVYYPSYRVYRGDTPAQLNYSCISHVFYAFAGVGQDGGVFLKDEYADAQLDVDGSRGCLGSLAAIKQRMPHLKVILSIGGAESSQDFAAVAASAALRDNFGRSARGLITASGLDGVDIDWEHPCDPQQGRDFLSLLATVRLHLPNDEYLLTAALPAQHWVLRHIDLCKAQEYLDFINLMAYDFAGPWTPTAGHHAQLHPGSTGEPSGSAAVSYVKSTGFPAKKILLGIPAYGRSFLGANGPGERCSGHGGEEGSFEYKDLPRPGTEEKVDTARVAASCVGGDGGFVSYDNQQTVTVKGKYCKAEQLGACIYLSNSQDTKLTIKQGLFYWTGTADAPQGLERRSLVEAGFKALHYA